MNSISTRRTFIKSLVAAGALSIPGCTALNKTSERPNILWLSCEDISPALGCYGDDYADTPNIDAIAREGIVYDNAFATAPICSPARSCLITGLYATSMGTQHLRSEITRPDFIKPLPLYLRNAGYYCTNNSKTDYNFDSKGLWDENNNIAHWRNKTHNHPFFSVFNEGITHEGHANSLTESDVQALEKRHDPDRAVLPPFYPNTLQMRKIWAHQYDLVSMWDIKVGKLINQLKADGLYEETIIFIFADHGFGLPRYKRWMTNSGIQVPLIVRVPEKFKHLVKNKSGSHCNDLVSFIDFAPTVSRLAGLPVSNNMQGYPFLGTRRPKQREYIFGARSRADDVYDISRAIRDKRYIYIRNFTPHQPYIQDAIIFGDDKAAFRELNRVRNTSALPPGSEAMYKPKPFEELYDLENDPHELKNLADSADHNKIKSRLEKELYNWILKSRDIGFLIEAEMMVRSQNSSPFELARDAKQYDLERILDTAKLVGNPNASIQDIQSRLNDNDSGVRFWAVMALNALGDLAITAVPTLLALLKDNSASVQILSAKVLCNLGHELAGLSVLEKHLNDDKEWMVLWTVINIRQIGAKAKPILSSIQTASNKYRGKVWNRYKNWLYPMFIGMALDKSMINCGIDIDLSH